MSGNPQDRLDAGRPHAERGTQYKRADGPVPWAFVVPMFLLFFLALGYLCWKRAKEREEEATQGVPKIGDTNEMHWGGGDRADERTFNRAELRRRSTMMAYGDGDSASVQKTTNTAAPTRTDRS